MLLMMMIKELASRWKSSVRRIRMLSRQRYHRLLSRRLSLRARVKAKRGVMKMEVAKAKVERAEEDGMTTMGRRRSERRRMDPP